MKPTRLFCLLLTLTLSLCACGGTSGGNDTSASKESDSSDTTAPEETRYTPDLPDITFNNVEYNVLGIMEPTSDSTYRFDSEENSGDVLDNAIYKRNRYVEEKYEVVFNYETVPGVYDTNTQLEKNVLSDIMVYDMYMLICRKAFAAAQNDYIYPVDDIPYLNLDAPWYIQSLNEQFKIDGKLFFAYSAECLNAYSQSTVVFYNKLLAENYQLDDLYETVRNGEWTIDKMLEYARLVKSTDNLGTDTVYGISTESDMLYPALWVGSGEQLIKKDADGIPEYTLHKNEKLLGILERCVDIFNEQNLVVHSNLDLPIKERIQGDILFSENKALFRVAGLCHSSNMRNMQADYGILPLPKYDAAQEDYVGRMCDGWLYVVPSNSDRVEMNGVIMEALAAESMNTTIPAYFDVVLDYKVSRDEEAVEMLDIIFDNISVDLGDTVWYDTLRLPITNTIISGNAAFASKAEELRPKMEAAIEDAVEALAALDE